MRRASNVVRIVVGQPVERVVSLATREILFREGDPGDRIYVVSSGAVRIVRERPTRVELAVLGPGSVFGESSLITGDRRNAMVEAICETQLEAIDRSTLFELVARDQSMRDAVLGLCRRRLIERALATHPLFEGLAAPDRRVLEARARYCELEPGEVIIQQGQNAQGLFVLLAGRAAVSRVEDGLPVPVATLGADDVCAEISFLTRGPAVANVEAETRCFALQILAPELSGLLALPEKRAFVHTLAKYRAQELDVIMKRATALPFAGGAHLV